ncbi:unnamed protein product [Echinostoma caproni]|uniref:Reverse transcriptase domain-containing protein n=1 Tax=Echinostoma caproni TaxID=27848 RepID=A0A183AZR3_9TREM|nr:unnamed protein product [Echinostoma caproni]
MTESQYGFVKQRSCLTNLFCFLEDVTAKIDEGKTVEVCYLDFNKAIHSMNHRVLLTKLERFGIQGQLHRWISAFLSQRPFYVTAGKKRPTPVQLTSKAPQGSVQGPLLFFLYVDDFPSTLTSSCYIFADDVKVIGLNGRSDLKRDLEQVDRWAKEWDLSPNATKSHVLTGAFERLEVHSEQYQFAIGPATRVKDLGVVLLSAITLI